MFLDLLHVLRTLRRSPASAAAAIITLSLTLGAGASIFAVVDAVLLTPPPFANPETLMLIGEVPFDQPSSASRTVPYATFERWRERAGSLAQLEAIDGTNLTLTGLGSAERVSGANVTPKFQAMHGAVPTLGRTLTDTDLGRPVIVVSERFWRAKLNADDSWIGRDIVLGNQPHTVVGVLGPRFKSGLGGDFVRPFPVNTAGYRVGGRARLAPGVTASALAAALTEVSRESVPSSQAVVTPIATVIASDAVGPLRLLGGAAALAMLIAFTNLAGLLTVRSIDRRRELAMRSALGANRLQVARNLLLEAQVIVALGTVGGVALALLLTPLAGQITLDRFGGVANREIAVSWRVIAAVALAASACALMCGALPAFVAARRNVIDILRRGATPHARELSLRRVFVAGQVAMAFVLLVSVALLGRSLFGTLRVHPGFDAHSLLVFSIALPSAKYDNQRVTLFYSTLHAALEQRIGSGSTGIIDELPLTGDRGRIVVSRSPAEPGREAVFRAPSRGYFGVMRIPLRAGRDFDSRDDAAAPLRVVVSESLALRLFESEQPIGRRLYFVPLKQMAEVVGVVGDVKHRALDEDVVPTVYVSAMQFPSGGTRLVVRSARSDADAIAAVRDEVAKLDRDLPVYGASTMSAVVAESPGLQARRALTASFTAFALLAVVLGGIGLVGVAAHDVACRRAELALRIALGADPKRIFGSTLGHSLVLVGLGLAVGVLASIWTTTVLRGFVVAANRFDVPSVVGSAALLLIAGVGAVLPAARRAARTDPLAALRE